jgi:hypothetical protein
VVASLHNALFGPLAGLDLLVGKIIQIGLEPFRGVELSATSRAPIASPPPSSKPRWWKTIAPPPSAWFSKNAPRLYTSHELAL